MQPATAKPLTDSDIQSAIDNKTKPVGALGRVEDVAAQLAQLQRTLTPSIHTCGLYLFAGDHGLAASGVSAYPQAVTRQMVENLLSGGACANAFASAVGATLTLIDAGVCGDPIQHPDLLDQRIAPGTKNSLTEAAMTSDQYDLAFQAGRMLGAAAKEDAICLGEMGIGNTASASLIVHKLLGLPLALVTGRGTGLDDDGLSRKLSILVKAASRTATSLSAQDALTHYGGFEIVMMVGAMIGAAGAHKPVLVDGFIATTAALAATKINPECRSAMVFTHLSQEAGHAPLLEALDARPLLNLDMRLGEGTGALLAWPIVNAAAAMLRDVASFDSAGVSQKDDAP